MVDKFWEDFGFVIRGKQRQEIIKLMDEPKTPTQLKEEIGKIHITNVCRVLRELEKSGLAKCITPDFKTGRVYALTQRAKLIRKKLIKS